MNRFPLIGLLALAGACDLPLVMLEIEAPNVCVTRQVSVDPTALASSNTIDPVDPQLPSQLGTDLSNAFGTTVEIDDNVLDLPAEAKGLLDLDVQIKLIRLQASDDPLTPGDESLALDGVRVVRIAMVAPDGSGLAPRTLLAYDRAAAGTPPGGTIEASGDEVNLAEYLYAGQLRFDYTIDVDMPAGPYTFAATACIATRGYVEASANDLRGL